MGLIQVNTKEIISVLWEGKGWITRSEFKRLGMEKLVNELNKEIRSEGGSEEIKLDSLMMPLQKVDITMVGLTDIKKGLGDAYVLKYGHMWDTQEELIRLIRDYAISLTEVYDVLVSKEVEKVSEKLKVYWKCGLIFLAAMLSTAITFTVLMAVSSIMYGLSIMPALLSGPIMILHAPNTLISSPSGIFIIIVSLFSGVASGVIKLKSFLKYIWTKKKGLNNKDIELIESDLSMKLSGEISKINELLKKHKKMKVEKRLSE